MEKIFLQEYLKTGLFEIGDNDERLTWLEQSIKDLTAKFENDYTILSKYTLVSLDPNISDTEPVMIETENIVTTYWKALRAKYTEMPRTIIRGVILNALNDIGISDPIAARIIYLAGQNYFPYSKLSTEESLVSDMLKRLGEHAERHAINVWTLPQDELILKLSTLKIPDLTEPLTPTQIETPINKFFTEFKKSLDVNLKATFASLRAVESRNRLLWWREALYSSSKMQSYRELDINLLPVIMSSDLNEQLPRITPNSVDYFLKNTVISLIGDEDKTIKFSEYLNQISNETLKEILKPYFNGIPNEEGRISLRSFITLLLNGKVGIRDFKERTGIEKSDLVTITDLAEFLLHDLLIERLIEQ